MRTGRIRHAWLKVRVGLALICDQRATTEHNIARCDVTAGNIYD